MTYLSTVEEYPSHIWALRNTIWYSTPCGGQEYIKKDNHDAIVKNLNSDVKYWEREWKAADDLVDQLQKELKNKTGG